MHGADQGLDFLTSMQESGDETMTMQKVTERAQQENLEKSDGHMHISQEFISRGKPLGCLASERSA